MCSSDLSRRAAEPVADKKLDDPLRGRTREDVRKAPVSRALECRRDEMRADALSHEPCQRVEGGDLGRRRVGVFAQGADAAPALTGSTATLELEPRQAELLAHSSRMGSIALSLRSVADVNENDGQPTANTSLLDGNGAESGGGVRVFKNGSASGGS